MSFSPYSDRPNRLNTAVVLTRPTGAFGSVVSVLHPRTAMMLSALLAISRVPALQVSRKARSLTVVEERNLTVLAFDERLGRGLQRRSAFVK